MQQDDASGRRIPSLVALCQRVAGAHVDSITSLGTQLPFILVKPILERCSAEQLLQLEETSPHLQDDTHEIWMDLCIRKYPTVVERYLLGQEDGQDTWKQRYFNIQEAEAKRLEELGSRLRSQRQEADERKREREVKLINPPKRFKNGWNISQPKTLFQKTRSEASKIQRTVYNARIIPPMPTAKTYSLTQCPTLLPAPPESNGQSSRVTVNTVRRPLSSISTTTSISKSPPKPNTRTVPSLAHPIQRAMPPHNSPGGSSTTASTEPLQSQALSAPADPPPPPPPSGTPRPPAKPSKKDPMACLFLPKHRAHSQRPTKS
ncbi:hypothetical protein AX17_002862 [Amanita inopinata Kibby_2008]|nr:hypothetical protein AX17_002862 [Amanita inopinata Kibby_2008]